MPSVLNPHLEKCLGELLPNCFQLHPPLECRCQLFFKLLEASLRFGNQRPGLLIELGLGHVAVKGLYVGFELFNRSGQAVELLSLFEGEFAGGRVRCRPFRRIRRLSLAGASG